LDNNDEQIKRQCRPEAMSATVKAIKAFKTSGLAMIAAEYYMHM
jgi:hypothetical protein